MKKGIFLLFCIPIVLNIGEIANPLLDKINLNLRFIFSYSIPLLLAFFLTKPIFLKRKKAQSFITKRLMILAMMSFALFIWFIFSNIQVWSLIDYAQFMESYRNGAFKGSGVFTYLATTIFPLTFCYGLLFYKIPLKQNVIFITIAIIPALLLGLRVWLIPLFIVSIMLFGTKKFNLFQFISYGIFLIAMILSTKLILAPEIYSSSMVEVVLKILSRTNYQAMTATGNFNLLYDLLDTQNIYLMKDYFYYRNQYHIESLYFNRIGNTGGLAMPLTIFLINTLGYFACSVLLFSAFLIISFFLRISSGHKVPLVVKNVCLNLVIILTSMIIEDIYFATKILIIPILIIIAQIIFVKKPFNL